MEYNQDKVDELTLALLYLGMSRRGKGGRAWKAFDLQTLTRLQHKGWIDEPRIKDISLDVTPEGVEKAEEFFKKHFQSS